MSESTEDEARVITLDGMYEEYFLDYASYVILERAVPAIEDGLKPVQRRILYSLREKDDGRYHKVANIIGHTMQYHPHGDAAIGDAMVHIGQKDLLIDTQGNWGDIRTGDSAAAPRYIEARLTKFALEVAFNKQTTEWQLSYDGRNKEPITLPMKFPLLVAQGVEGIAVGLSTKILPHNFVELIRASVNILKGKRVKIYPDFQTGGMIDIADYQGGKRGGKVKVRAKMDVREKSKIIITELPYGTTTGSLIDSIIKANDKGQIKIKKVVDNTAKDVEIEIDLPSGVSPEVTVDALYAFTNCEISISPNACVIVDNKPQFLTVEELLQISTANTKDLLRQELEIRRGELEAKWHMASLEKIFIENRIYRDIEEAESFEEVLTIIDAGLRKYVATPSDDKGERDKRLRLRFDITEEDLIRLTEIKIKRISKYNKFKHEEQMAKLLEELEEVNHHLEHLTEYAIDYFQRLLDKYGAGKERRTEITSFETIKAVQVAAINAKLYVNRKEGFIGTSLKKDEFVTECSDIADIIVFLKDGHYQVSRIGEKVFVGKNIIHIAVWKKGDDRTTYNLVYTDGATGKTMAKRFHVTAITRDKPYPMTKGTKGSKVHHFSAHPNGESELLQVTLTPGCKAKKKVFDLDLGELLIKGRGAGGNVVTKYPVKKVTLLEVGESTLGARQVWLDETSGRLNEDERGTFLGDYDSQHQLLSLYADGTYEVRQLELDTKIDMDKWIETRIVTTDAVISALYFEGDKGWSMVKRFRIETAKTNERYYYLTESTKTKLSFATSVPDPLITYAYKDGRRKVEEELAMSDFIDVKGWKAIGNKLGEFKVVSTKLIGSLSMEEGDHATPEGPESSTDPDDDDKYQPGDTIELF
ncbi:MAG: DNA gyrase/topoisomerase IV subunit A [Bacteroidota bacterium]